MTKKIEFTDRAKEQIEKIIDEDQLKKFFRISVKGGGCSGFKYDFSFDNKIDNKDIVFGKTVIDKTSLDIIAGSILGLIAVYIVIKLLHNSTPSFKLELIAGIVKRRNIQ